MARQGQIKNMEVMEDFESRPHKLLTFLVESDKELQELSELKMPKPCQDTMVANCQEDARRKEVKKGMECLKEEDGWRRRR